jgi:hypothetical protein
MWKTTHVMGENTYNPCISLISEYVNNSHNSETTNNPVTKWILELTFLQKRYIHGQKEWKDARHH